MVGRCGEERMVCLVASVVSVVVVEERERGCDEEVVEGWGRG